MDITGLKLWQQAAGDTDRNYVNYCLKWDVILFGPGYAGKYPECVPTLQDDGWTPKKITNLRRFAEEMQDGHVVVLRLGTSCIYAVGLIIGPYEWRQTFSDMDGWDLQHVRRVRWVWKAVGGPQVFDSYTLKLGDTTQELTSPTVIEWLKSLFVSEEALRRPLVKLPIDKEYTVSHRQIGEYLYDQGVASGLPRVK